MRKNVNRKTIEKYGVVINNVFEASSTKYISSKRFNTLLTGVDPYLKKSLVDKGILSKVSKGRNSKYKWNTIKPTKDMTVALATRCYEYNKERRDSVKTVTKAPIARKTNVKQNITPKYAVSYLWGLYTKKVY